MKIKKIVSLMGALFLFFLCVFPLQVLAASCPNCGKALKLQVQSAATCTGSGIQNLVCLNCGYMEEKNVPPLGHSYSKSTEATCTKGGRAYYTCKRCGDRYEGETGPLGHKFARTTVDPTCTEDGEDVSKCLRCGLRKVTVLPATGHSFELLETPATCTENGEIRNTCAICGETEIEVLPATGHTLRLQKKPATCTEDGEQFGTCTVCGEAVLESIPATGHDYQRQETPATCTKGGIRTDTCTRCGDTVNETIPAMGHSFGEWITTKKPTLFQAGYEERTCIRCGEPEGRELPKKKLKQNPGAIAAITGGAIAIISAIAFAVKKTAATAAAEAAKASFFGFPTLELKKLLLYVVENERNNAFLKHLGNRPYLDIKTVTYGDAAALADTAKEEKPDLILLSCSDVAALQQLLTQISAGYEDADYAVIDETGCLEAALSAMQDSGTIMSFASCMDKDERKIVKLILPLYKPDRSASNWVENATLVTDALGLPIISLLMRAYIVGDDVVTIVKNRQMDALDTADIISDAACLLGLDTLASIAELLLVGSEQKERLEDKKELSESLKKEKENNH